MTTRKVFLSVGIGAGLGAMFALPMTYIDWRLNPGGIFHGSSGTDWSVVSETALSWFLPVFAAGFATALIVAYLVRRR